VTESSALPETDAAEAGLAPLVSAWSTLPDVAEKLGVDIMKVRQFVRERQLLAVRTEGVLRIPSIFIGDDGLIIKGLPGVLTLLQDAGYSDAEAMTWLFTPQDDLPGAPVEALAENRGTETKRRAQALGF
jgi:hypothetical protein